MKMYEFARLPRSQWYNNHRFFCCADTKQTTPANQVFRNVAAFLAKYFPLKGDFITGNLPGLTTLVKDISIEHVALSEEAQRNDRYDVGIRITMVDHCAGMAPSLKEHEQTIIDRLCYVLCGSFQTEQIHVGINFDHPNDQIELGIFLENAQLDQAPSPTRLAA